MRRFAILFAFGLASWAGAAAPALADMDCGVNVLIDNRGRHYADCLTYDGGEMCYRCPNDYRPGGSVAACRRVSCSELPPQN